MYKIELNIDQVDEILINELQDTRSRFLEDIETIKSGTLINCFFFNDALEDIAEMERHVDALDILISWYGVPELDD